MSRCDRMVDIGRRRFLGGASFATAGVAGASFTPTPTKAASAGAAVDYPSNRLGNVRELNPTEPKNVAYPDADAPGLLLKLGKKVPGGIGADGDIVGFSTICPYSLCNWLYSCICFEFGVVVQHESQISGVLPGRIGQSDPTGHLSAPGSGGTVGA